MKEKGSLFYMQLLYTFLPRKLADEIIFLKTNNCNSTFHIKTLKSFGQWAKDLEEFNTNLLRI